MKYFVSIATLLLATATQAQTLNGVYVGAELYNTPFNGMQINHLVYYFKPDGQFNDQLNTADWKTRSSGKYSITNNVVRLQFSNKKEAVSYKLAANGNLESMAGIKHTLHKVKKVNSLPASGYGRKTAAVSGGMGTGMPTVGAFSADHLYFDGKGNFSFDHSGLVGVGSESAAGKFDKNDKTSGTYKLGDGEITLTFRNGTVSKHTFFYSPPAEEDLIVLDGAFYFREEKENEPAAEKTTTDLPTPVELLNKMRSRYGGINIDKITTLKETNTLFVNLQAVVYTDITHKRIRAEFWQGSKLLLVKQVDGEHSFEWMNNSRKQLSDQDKSELLLSLYQGILGLHRNLHSFFLKGKVTRSEENFMVSFFVDGQEMAYLVGPDYSLKANAYSVNKVVNLSIYKNFMTSNGITYPAITESSVGKTKMTVTTTALEINPVLPAATWKAP